MKFIPNQTRTFILCLSAFMLFVCAPVFVFAEQAPVNPFNGIQSRENIFEFADKPKVEKQGAKFFISFSVKAKCDVTVQAVDKEGRVVAHIGSGVLGSNAPYPFQQNSLNQKIEWDGKDNLGKPVSEGCKIKVSLGLKANFERVMGWDPYNFSLARTRYKVINHKMPDGNTMVANDTQVLLFDKEGKYVRTLAPHPANIAKEEISGLKHLKTVHGDEIPIPPGPRGWRMTFHVFSLNKSKSPFSADPANNQLILAVPGKKRGSTEGHYAINSLGSFKKVEGAGAEEVTFGNPSGVQPSEAAPEVSYGSDNPRLAVDPIRDRVYVSWGIGNAAMNRNGLTCYDGKTGKLVADFPQKKYGAEDFDVGPDGYLYARVDKLGKYIIKLDPTGKVVPFENGVTVTPKLSGYKESTKAVWSGQCGSGGNTHAKGFDISPTGNIYVNVQYLSPSYIKARFNADGSVKPITIEERIKLYPVAQKERQGSGATKFKELGGTGHALAVHSPDGNEITLNAIKGIPHAHGLRTDRWGNIYLTIRSLPNGQLFADGMQEGQQLARNTSAGMNPMIPAGSIVKFQGGNKYPIGGFRRTGTGPKFKRTTADKALWAYGGISPSGGSACSCTHCRFDVDPYGRAFVPQAYMYSVQVVDSNSNLILRIGRYGNADSQGPGSAVPEPEIAFGWVRAVAISDNAMYALDYGNKRILKVKLGYEIEEETVVP